MLAKDRVGIGRHRTVRRFGEDAGTDCPCVGGGDLALECGEDQDVDVEPEQLVIRDRPRAGSPGYRAVFMERVST